MTLEEMIGQFKAYAEYPNQDTFVISNQECKNILKYLTESQKKVGHWVMVSAGYGNNAYICECSVCKDTVWVYKNEDRRWKYCPNCGAKMTESEDKNDNRNGY